MRIGGRQKLGAVVQSRCEIDPKSRAWLPVLSRPRGREAALMDFEVAPLSPALSFSDAQLIHALAWGFAVCFCERTMSAWSCFHHPPLPYLFAPSFPSPRSLSSAIVDFFKGAEP